MCKMIFKTKKLGHMRSLLQLFICFHGKCIAVIYIFHDNSILNLSVYFHGKTMYSNYEPYFISDTQQVIFLTCIT